MGQVGVVEVSPLCSTKNGASPNPPHWKVGGTKEAVVTLAVNLPMMWTTPTLQTLTESTLDTTWL